MIRGRGNNALTRDRGWKTHVLLLGDGNEIHETSRVTSSFVCLRSGFLDAPTIMEDTREAHANAADRRRTEWADFILDCMQPLKETPAQI